MQRIITTLLLLCALNLSATPTTAQRLAFEQSLLGTDKNQDGDFVDKDAGDIQGILAFVYPTGAAINSPVGIPLSSMSWRCAVYVTTTADGTLVEEKPLTYVYARGTFRVVGSVPQNWTDPGDQTDILTKGSGLLAAMIAAAVPIPGIGKTATAETHYLRLDSTTSGASAAVLQLYFTDSTTRAYAIWLDEAGNLKAFPAEPEPSGW